MATVDSLSYFVSQAGRSAGIVPKDEPAYRPSQPMPADYARSASFRSTQTNQQVRADVTSMFAKSKSTSQPSMQQPIFLSCIGTRPKQLRQNSLGAPPSQPLAELPQNERSGFGAWMEGGLINFEQDRLNLKEAAEREERARKAAEYEAFLAAEAAAKQPAPPPPEPTAAPVEESEYDYYEDEPAPAEPPVEEPVAEAVDPPPEIKTRELVKELPTRYTSVKLPVGSNVPFEHDVDDRAEGKWLAHMLFVAPEGFDAGDVIEFAFQPLVSLKLEAKSLEAKDNKRFKKEGSSDPYIKLFGTGPDGRVRKVMTTNVVKKSLNATFNGVLAGETLANLAEPTNAASLHAEVWDWDVVTADDLIGSVELPAALLKWLILAWQQQRPDPYTCPPLTLLSKKGKPAGELTITAAMA